MGLNTPSELYQFAEWALHGVPTSYACLKKRRPREEKATIGHSASQQLFFERKKSN